MTENKSTQTDRILAVLLTIGYMVGLFVLLQDSEVSDRIVAYYSGAGAIVIVPVVIYLLAHVLSFKGLSDKIDAVQSVAADTNTRTLAIEHATNGNLTARLDKQTSEIVEQVTVRVLAALAPDTTQPHTANYAPDDPRT